MTPAAWSSRSVRLVLPASTWARMPRLRVRMHVLHARRYRHGHEVSSHVGPPRDPPVGARTESPPQSARSGILGLRPRCREQELRLLRRNTRSSFARSARHLDIAASLPHAACPARPPTL